MIPQAELDSIAGRLSGEHGVFATNDLVSIGGMAVVRPGATTAEGVVLSGEEVQRLLGDDWQVFPVSLAYAPDPERAMAVFGNEEVEDDLAAMEKALDALDAAPSMGAVGKQVRRGIARRYQRVLNQYGKCQRLLLSGKGRIPPGYFLHPLTALVGLFSSKSQKLVWQARRCDRLLARLTRIRARLQGRGFDISTLPDPGAFKMQILREHNELASMPSAQATVAMPGAYPAGGYATQTYAPYPSTVVPAYTQVSQAMQNQVDPRYLQDQAALERELESVMPSFGEDADDDLDAMERDLDGMENGSSDDGGDVVGAMGKAVRRGMARRYQRVLDRYARCQRLLLSGKGRIPLGYFATPLTAIVGLFASKDQKMVWRARRCDRLLTRLVRIRARLQGRGFDISSLQDPATVKHQILQEHNRLASTSMSAPTTTAALTSFYPQWSQPIQQQPGGYVPVSQAMQNQVDPRYLQDQAALERELEAVMPSYLGSDVASLAADLRADSPGFLFSGVEHDYFGIGGTDAEILFSDEEDLLEEDGGDALGGVGDDLGLAPLSLRRNNLRLRLRLAEIAREPATTLAAIRSRISSVESRLSRRGSRLGAVFAAAKRPTPEMLRLRAANLALRAKIARASGASSATVAPILERRARALGRFEAMTGDAVERRCDPAALRRLLDRRHAASLSGDAAAVAKLGRQIAYVRGAIEGKEAQELPAMREELGAVASRRARSTPRRVARAARAEQALVARDARLPEGLARRLNLRRTQLLHEVAAKRAAGRDVSALHREIERIDARLRTAAPGAGLDPRRLLLRSPRLAGGPTILAIGIRRRPPVGVSALRGAVRAALAGSAHRPLDPDLLDVFAADLARVSHGWTSLDAMSQVRRATDPTDWMYGSAATFPMGADAPLPPPRRAGAEVYA